MYQSAYRLNQEFVSKLYEKIQAIRAQYTATNSLSTFFTNNAHLFLESLPQLIDTTYWASQAVEEGQRIKFSLVFREQERASNIFCFEKAISLDVKNLVKLGSALDNSFSDICVYRDESGHLKIWGLRIRSPNHLTTDFWIQVLGPGNLLIICYGRSVAAVYGNQTVFINPSNLFKVITPKIVSKTDAPEVDPRRFLRLHTLLYIAQAMRAHQRGGTLLVVPHTESWQDSIGQPVIYAGGTTFLEPEFNTIAVPSPNPSVEDLLQFITDAATEKDQLFMKIRTQVLEQCSRIGRLTAIDGALVMTYDREICCFGAKIQAINTQPGSKTVKVIKPVEGDEGSRMILGDLGGTRHLSAAQFAYDQPNALAIVASQDGTVSLFSRDAADGELLVVQQAELALMHEGIGGVLWNLVENLAQEPANAA